MPNSVHMIQQNSELDDLLLSSYIDCRLRLRFAAATTGNAFRAEQVNDTVVRRTVLSKTRELQVQI